jgi:MtN3 and saliva related transmembrane protein
LKGIFKSCSVFLQGSFYFTTVEKISYSTFMIYTTILGLSAAVCTTVSFLPQAIKTIKTKNTTSISLFMYSLFAFGTLLWLSFGILTNNLPVTLANAITFVFAAVILVYKIIYK